MSFSPVCHHQLPVRWYRCFLLLLLLTPLGPLGCQMLFHDKDAILKGQTVNLAVTVPQVPPPASRPLSAPPAVSPQPPAPHPPPLPPQLLPQQRNTSQNLAALPPGVQTANGETFESIRALANSVDIVLSGRTITEDTTLSGTVLITGSLVVAPQATLRLAPGARLFFQRPPGSQQHPRLVIQGRLVVAGTPQQPVLLTAAAYPEVQSVDWGGVLLLNTEKKNRLDYCHIQGAETGLEARYAQFDSRGLEITRSRDGMALYDSVATLQATNTMQRCDRGLVADNSELEMHGVLLRENRLGAALRHTSLMANDCRFFANSQDGLELDHCRFRITGSQAVQNRTGLLVQGGEGQLQRCRFAQNRASGVSLTEARVKIVNTSFQENGGVGLRLEASRGSVTQSTFTQNRGGNLVNLGTDGFAAVLNWWGTGDEAHVMAGIRDATRDAAGIGRISFVPLLTSPPPLVP